MSEPERLNVLITRARNCLIMLGNMETFMKSKGNSTWVPFFEILKKRDHLYDGFPIRCERHPDKVASLKEPNDFDKYSPDGGCEEPWYVADYLKFHVNTNLTPGQWRNAQMWLAQV